MASRMARVMAPAIANRMAELMRSLWQNDAPNPNPNPNPKSLLAVDLQSPWLRIPKFSTREAAMR